LSSTASEDTLASAARLTNIAWSPDADEVFGTHKADGLLEVISARAASGQTGAAWQRATLAAAKRRHNPKRALAIMLNHYLQYAETGLPVHTWPVAS
jgi:hypothetical protein